MGRTNQFNSLANWHWLVFAILILLFSFVMTPADAASQTELSVTPLKESSFSARFDGVDHSFILDLPPVTDGAPLVFMLPGYGNTAESFRRMIHFEQDANKLGYAVAYVTGAQNPDDRTSAVGWNYGVGNNKNDDVSFLTALAIYLQKAYSFDRSRTFAVGFSNGAFMVHRLAMEAGDTFSAFVSVAGTMPGKIWDSRNDEHTVSFFQITGEKDDVIPKKYDGSAKYAQAPAIEDVMDYWAASNGLNACESEEVGRGSLITKYRSEEKMNQVWNLFIKNGRHSWPDEKLSGIDINRLIIDFFESVSHVS